ncbi:MAG TPA: LPS assembly lipoprotein LptE [Hyphomicrobium sp.]|jgi:LPS-assembly lipoprotein
MLATGCGDSGFRPLYATSSITGSNSDVNEKLAKLEIAPIPSRVGQRVRNELIFQATGGGNAASQPVYRLEIVLTESISATLVQIDGNSSGSVYNLNASFRLVRLDDRSVALQGQSFGRAAFQRFDSVYSNVRARHEAEDRAAQTIADDLKSRLAAYLSGAA